MLATLGAAAVIASQFPDTEGADETSPEAEATAPLEPAAPNLLPASQEPSLSLARECASECFGVEAGYRWAAAREIDRAEDCASYSESFNDGCRAYAREREESLGTTTLVVRERRPAVYVSLGETPFQTPETLRR